MAKVCAVICASFATVHSTLLTAEEVKAQSTVEPFCHRFAGSVRSTHGNTVVTKLAYCSPDNPVAGCLIRKVLKDGKLALEWVRRENRGDECEKYTTFMS